jgi:hypothetical protein
VSKVATKELAIRPPKRLKDRSKEYGI